MILLPGGSALLALASAIIWGGGDFSGAVAVKAAGGTIPSAVRVVLLSHTVSFLILLLLSLLWGAHYPSRITCVWALLAGLFAGLSLSAFYVALSAGEMGTAAALSGLLAAAIPAFVSTTTEGPPGLLRLGGFALAGLAIWLVAAGPEPTPPPTPHTGSPGRRPTAPIGPARSRRAIILAISAGVGFGLYFVSMKMAGRGGLLWPMTTVRLGSALTCATLVLITLKSQARTEPPSLPADRVAATPRSPYLPPKAVLWAMGPALLDTGANLLFMQATRIGRLDVASVLASLYPASTILLAAWLLHERPTRRQALGMFTAAAAVLMITL